MEALSGIPIYVISLPGSNRRPWMERILTRAGLAFSFWDACDPGSLSGKLTDTARFFEGDMLEYIDSKPGTVCCALSHVLLWRHLHSNATLAGSAIVLEDDVAIEPDFLEKVQPFLSGLPPDFHMFFLAGWPYDSRFFLGQRRINRYLAKLTNFGLHSTAAYLINISLIPGLLKVLIPFTTEIDVHIAYRSDDLNVYLPAVRPRLCTCQIFENSERGVQDEKPSTSAGSST